MNIRDIIEKHGQELINECHDDKVYAKSRTEYDVIQDIFVTAMKKYKEKEIDEEEGLSYMKHALYAEKHFQRKRLKDEPITYVENLEDLGV